MTKVLEDEARGDVVLTGRDDDPRYDEMGMVNGKRSPTGRIAYIGASWSRGHAQVMLNAMIQGDAALHVVSGGRSLDYATTEAHMMGRIANVVVTDDPPKVPLTRRMAKALSQDGFAPETTRAERRAVTTREKKKHKLKGLRQ